MLPIIRRADALRTEFRSHLRLVEPSDADFIVKLRTDTNLNRHLSPSSVDIEAQKDWIVRYKEREQHGAEYYFVIVSDRIDLGLVRMYDFRTINGLRSFCWGSWIITTPRPPGLVTFSALLMYELGFDVMRFERAHFDVRKANTGVIAFHKRAGAHYEGEDSENLYFQYMPEDYVKFRLASATRISEHRVIR